MVANQHAELVASEIHRLLKNKRGAQAKACRQAGVSKNYFLEAIERGSIDMVPLMIALDVLRIHPVLFFESLFAQEFRSMASGLVQTNE